MKIDLYCQRCIDFFILLGVPPLVVYSRNTVSENGDFLALCVNISKTVRDMRFRLAPRSMTLNDLELLYV